MGHETERKKREEEGLGVQVDKIAAVLLPDGKWHAVEEGTCEIGDYSLLEKGERKATIYTGHNRIFEWGMAWVEEQSGERFVCTLASVLGMRFRTPLEEEGDLSGGRASNETWS